jgi:hypothetical protein
MVGEMPPLYANRMLLHHHHNNNESHPKLGKHKKIIIELNSSNKNGNTVAVEVLIRQLVGRRRPDTLQTQRTCLHTTSESVHRPIICRNVVSDSNQNNEEKHHLHLLTMIQKSRWG